MNSTSGHVRSNSNKRPSSPDGSREHPIIIDDDTEPRINMEASPQKRQRTSHYLDKSVSLPSKELSDVDWLLRFSQRIVVISGAGVSAKAGFPTFQEMRKCKQTFHQSLYSSPEEIVSFHSSICSMFETLRSDQCKPTPFHQIMDGLAREHRLLRHITQNIDCLETKFEHLNTKTIRLHGQIDQMKCEICNKIDSFEPQLFHGVDLPHCKQCNQRSQDRISLGKRKLSIGRLKPNILLYGDSDTDSKIDRIIHQDCKAKPDLVLVVGTKLQVPGAQKIAKKLCQATHEAGGVTVWIGFNKPPRNVRFNLVIEGDCHDLSSA